MREAHREAARCLYEERNKNASQSDEIYTDLHGLHPAEAISYLDSALNRQRSVSAIHRDAPRYLYAIVGTGHHSKQGRDKVGKAIRVHLNECRYAFREFSVPGDRLGSGGILGIDVFSGTTVSTKDEKDASSSAEQSSSIHHGKVRILKASDAKDVGL